MEIELNQVIAGMLLLLEGYADDFDIKFAIAKLENAGFKVTGKIRIAAGYNVPELNNKNSTRYLPKKRELETLATDKVIEFLTTLDLTELVLRKFSQGSRTIYQNITPGIMSVYQEGYLNFDFSTFTYSISEKGKSYLKSLEGNPRERK